MIALIDGDWLLYTAGFACQHTEYCVNMPADCSVYGSLKDLKENYEPDAMPDIYSRTYCDPIDHTLHTVKHMIQRQLDDIQEKFGQEVVPRVLMDGDGNFRTRLATIRPYKGNRALNSKPMQYNDIRQYLLENWGAEVVHGQETDDAMAQIMTANPADTVIVAVDKDMLQVPGWHKNPNKGFKRVRSAEGQHRLYAQAASGDATDNIGGCYKVGPKKAKAAFHPLQTPLAMWQILVELYAQSIERYGNQYNGLTAAEAALENMQLVYLRREAGVPFVVPVVD